MSTTPERGRQTMLGGIAAIWMRHYRVWLRIFWPSVVSGILNPILFLFAFGFGLGAVVKQVGDISYLHFVVPGMIANAALFQSSFEASIPSYTRFRIQRTYEAMLAAPLFFREVVYGEILWAASKGVLSALCLYLVAWAVDGLGSLSGALISFPLVALSCASFASLGLVCTAYARTYEYFSFFFVFWITPSLLFCGVFVDPAAYPQWLQWATWFFPVKHLIEVIRPLCAGLSVDWTMVALHMAYIMAFMFICAAMAARRMAKKLFD
ncbi:MAG: hypothetical protein GC134_07820 [Proteobacteria bacterium]|nr:hypothetical protein [Pseudomonadota bacterium]